MNEKAQPTAEARTSLIGRLRFPQKLVLLSLVFVVPAIIAIVFLVRFTQEQIDFTRKEKLGTEVIAPLGDLSLVMQRHGAATAIAASGGTPRTQEIATLRKRAGDDIATVDRWMSSHGDSWGMRRDWDRFKGVWQGQQRQSNNASTATEEHAAQIARLGRLISQASDVSNITLDPEMAAYMLGNTTVNNIPSATANGQRAIAIALFVATLASACGGARDALDEAVPPAEVAVQVNVTLAVSVDTVVGPQPVCEVMLDCASVTVHPGVTGPCTTAPSVNPVSVLVAGIRTLFGNPVAPVTKHSWPIDHPVAASWIYVAILLVIGYTVAQRRYAHRTND